MAIPAPSLKKFLADATARWPNRSRVSDGIMPSAEHSQQNPNSDHERGNAGDLTCDIQHGVDCGKIADELAESRDKRIKYIIWNRKIWYPTAGIRPKGWSRYTGPNPHTKHIHVSIKPEARNDLSPWPGIGIIYPSEEVKPVLKRGDRGSMVQLLQCHLGIEADGVFGFGTERALKRFQEANQLEPDGICGSKSWAALDRLQPKE